MDATPLFPNGFHPVRQRSLPDVSGTAPRRTRVEAPVRYYYIDFGISVRIPPETQPKLATGILGRDRDPPELLSDEPYDPFKLDVFIIGNLLRKEFQQARSFCSYPPRSLGTLLTYWNRNFRMSSFYNH